jgi:hypothetical protein
MADALNPSNLLAMIAQILGPSMFGGKPGAAASPIAGGVPGVSAQAPQQQAPNASFGGQPMPMPQGASDPMAALLQGQQQDEPSGLMKGFLAPGTQGVLGGLMGAMQGAQNHRGILPILLSGLMGATQGYGGEEDQMRKEQQQMFENTIKSGEYNMALAKGAPVGVEAAKSMIANDPVWSQNHVTPDMLAPLTHEEILTQGDTLQQRANLLVEKQIADKRDERFHTDHEQDIQRSDADREQAHADSMANVGATRGATEAQRATTNELAREHLDFEKSNAAATRDATAATRASTQEDKDMALKEKLGTEYDKNSHWYSHGGPTRDEFVKQEFAKLKAAPAPAAPAGPKPPPKLTSDSGKKVFGTVFGDSSP